MADKKIYETPNIAILSVEVALTQTSPGSNDDWGTEGWGQNPDGDITGDV